MGSNRRAKRERERRDTSSNDVFKAHKGGTRKEELPHVRNMGMRVGGRAFCPGRIDWVPDRFHKEKKCGYGWEKRRGSRCNIRTMGLRHRRRGAPVTNASPAGFIFRSPAGRGRGVGGGTMGFSGRTEGERVTREKQRTVTLVTADTGIKEVVGP